MISVSFYEKESLKLLRCRHLPVCGPKRSQVRLSPGDKFCSATVDSEVLAGLQVSGSGAAAISHRWKADKGIHYTYQTIFNKGYKLPGLLRQLWTKIPRFKKKTTWLQSVTAVNNRSSLLALITAWDANNHSTCPNNRFPFPQNNREDTSKCPGI